MLNSEFVYPKRTALKPKVVERFKLMPNSVIKILRNNSSKIAFTIEGWTSVVDKSFYGITAHCIDNNFQLQSLVIDFTASNEYHMGRDIAE